jgi:hypothetical protein
MQTERKAQLVQDWGFVHSANDCYVRDIYKAEGYREHWYESQPDLIVFTKDGVLSHDYVIDWSLFS